MAKMQPDAQIDDAYAMHQHGSQRPYQNRSEMQDLLRCDSAFRLEPKVPTTTGPALAHSRHGCSPEIYDSIIKTFLDELDFCLPSFGRRISARVEQEVLQYFSLQSWSERDLARAKLCVPWICDGITRSYNLLDDAILREIAIFSTYLFMVDDHGASMAADLRDFTQSLLCRREPVHPILRSLLDFLPSMNNHYGPFATDMFLVGTINFFNGCLLEQRPNGCFDRLPGALDFPQYFRAKTGYAETYALFVFPETLFPEAEYLKLYQPIIPSLMDFINHSNDLLSFHKESIIGEERTNFVFNYARANEVSVEVALRKTAQTTLKSIKTIRLGLADRPELLEVADTFINGYLAYHLTCPRYKLAGLAALQRLKNDCQHPPGSCAKHVSPYLRAGDTR